VNTTLNDHIDIPLRNTINDLYSVCWVFIGNGNEGLFLKAGYCSSYTHS
jgi:hypothetical protein